jgi:hypothetical protein
MNYYSLLFWAVLSMSGLQAAGCVEQAAGCVEQATPVGIPGVNPTRRPVLRVIPRDFFYENRKNVTIERISENMIYVRDNGYVRRGRRKQKFEKYTPPSSDEES